MSKTKMSSSTSILGHCGGGGDGDDTFHIINMSHFQYATLSICHTIGPDGDGLHKQYVTQFDKMSLVGALVAFHI